MFTTTTMTMLPLMLAVVTIFCSTNYVSVCQLRHLLNFREYLSPNFQTFRNIVRLLNYKEKIHIICNVRKCVVSWAEAHGQST